MRILFVTPSFYPAAYYGGPIFMTYGLCNSLAKIEGIRLRVLTTDANGPDDRVAVSSIPQTLDAGYEVYYSRRVLQPDISPGLLFRLSGMIRQSDVVHLNGVYSFTTLPTLILCRLLRKPVVWSPLGALQRWGGTTRKRFKRIWETSCDFFCEPERVVLHVTSEEERDESLHNIHHVKSAVIRNGIDLPGLNGTRHFSPAGKIRLLYIGRLHPIKGIENLLQAMARLNSNVRLSICGEGEVDYQNRLQSLVMELGLNGSVRFHGRVDGEAKEKHFREADLCIVPSFKESFCMVVGESLARGVPVIASRGTPWQRVEDMNCGMWILNDIEELSRAITQAANMPLREMGMRGREWMEREYSWSTVAAEMVEQYRSVIRGQRTRRSI